MTNEYSYWLEQEVSAGTITAEEASKYLAKFDEDILKKFGRTKNDPLYKARRAVIFAGIAELQNRASVVQQVTAQIANFFKV